MQKKIIYFDGVCNLCTQVVQFVLQRNKKKHLYFASLQSESGQKLCAENKFNNQDFDSFIFYDNGSIFTKSKAALKVARELDGIWPILYVFMIIPAFIRDYVYNVIAKNRYRWFGKKEECWLPTPDLQRRFLP
jgi:predicted DCC family thiol-disulfide oxidoreductase YuxK